MVNSDALFTFPFPAASSSKIAALLANGIVPPAFIAPEAPNVQSKSPAVFDTDQPSCTEDPLKSTVTVVTSSLGPHTNTGAVTSDTTTVA